MPCTLPMLYYVCMCVQLLMLEAWFRSDAQEETRRHLQEARDTMHQSLHRENIYEDRLFTLQGIIKDLVGHIHSLNTKIRPVSPPPANDIVSDKEDDGITNSLGDLSILDSERVIVIALKMLCCYRVTLYFS